MLDLFVRRAVVAATALALTYVDATAQTFHIVAEKSLFFQKRPCGPSPREVQECVRGLNVKDCVELRTIGRFGMMRVGVAVQRGPEPNWFVRVRDGVQRTVLDEIPIAPGQTFVWTDDVPSHGVYLDLMNAGAKTEGQIDVKRIDCTTDVAYQQAIVGVNGLADLIEISGPYEWVKAVGRSVAKLRFMTPTGEATCTGFLVDVDTLMTNEHCINTEDKLQSLVVEFGYDAPGAKLERFRGKEIIDKNAALDYSLVSVRGSPGKRWGVLEFSLDRPDGHDLVIIQHPLGRPTQVSIERCTVTEVGKLGAGQIKSDFAHGCDTLSGSSGSPVIDAATRKVIGLHHFGFLFDDKPAINQAVVASELPRRR